MKKAYWLWGAGVALILIAAFVLWYRKPALDITYSKIQPTRDNIRVTIIATGVVQPENRLEIKAPVAGRVEEVLVKEGQNVRKGQLLAWMSSTERAALLDAARAKGPEELKHWEEIYKATPIMAPINGMIIFRNVEPGQTFTVQDSIFVMSDRLTIKAKVDETDIAQIRLKQRAQLILDAYPKEILPAAVDQIAFDAKTVNNVTTYTVDVLPDKTPAFMLSGMTANITVFVESKDNVLTIPSEALKADEGKFYVLVTPPNGGKAPERRPVEIGISDGKKTEVLSGVDEKDTLWVAQIKAKSDKGQTNPFSPMGQRRNR